MIDVTTSTLRDGADWHEVWTDVAGRNGILASGRDLVEALMTAEKALRQELDRCQAQLHEARTAQKAEAV